MIMLKIQQDIYDFMVKAGQETPDIPHFPSDQVKNLRIKLIQEELNELKEAFEHDDFKESCDAIVDILVVTIGAAVALGIDIEPFWNMVHKSNMAKFGQGGYRRDDGKWMKPPDWKKHDFEPIIQQQIRERIKYAQSNGESTRERSK